MFPLLSAAFPLEKSQHFIAIKISHRVTVTKKDIKLVDRQPGQSRSIKINLLCGYLDRFSLYVHLNELFALHGLFIF